jgi:hypothetical protein
LDSGVSVLRSQNTRLAWSPTHWLLVYSLFLFVSFNVVGEIAARTLTTQSAPPNPFAESGYGAAIAQFERIARYVEQHGAPNCIFFGSSLVRVGVDPVIVQTAFEQAGGGQLMCYNFGVDGSTLSSTAPMAMIVSRLYQPEYLIVGVSAGQFFLRPADRITQLAEDQFQHNSRVRHLLGEFNLNEWLLDNTALYRVLKAGARRAFPNQHVAVRAEALTDADARIDVSAVDKVNGYRAWLEYRDTSPVFRPNSAYWSGRQRDQQDFDALERLIIDARNEKRLLIFIEMPVWERTNEATMVVSQAKALINQHDARYLSLEYMPRLPATAFADTIHLHISGSQQFSVWLGAQLAEVVKRDDLADPADPAWAPNAQTWPEPLYKAWVQTLMSFLLAWAGAEAH